MRSLKRFAVLAFGLSSIGSGVTEAADYRQIVNWPAPLYWASARRDVPAPRGQSTGAIEQFAPSTPLPFIALAPCRVADTRGNGFSGPFGPPYLAAGTPRDFPIAGQCGIPAGAVAVSLNLTVTETSATGYLVAFAQGDPIPPTSNLNYSEGQTVANAAIVALGATGGITVVPVAAGLHLIVDTNGYYAGTVVTSLSVGAGLSSNATTGDVTLNIASGGIVAGQLSSAGSSSGQALVSSGSSVSWGQPATAAHFTGSLAGEVTGTQDATTVSNATPNNSPGSIVRRDAAGNFATRSITLTGNLDFPATASDGASGVLTQTGVRLLHTAGSFPNFSVFLGIDAGNFTTTGQENVGVGWWALEGIGNGIRNTAVGTSSLNQNTTGSGNTGVGSWTLRRNSSGTRNTALGFYALGESVMGQDNTAVGAQAMQYCNGCKSNIAIGSNGGYFIEGDNNIDIGNLSNFDDSNTIRIGESTHKTTFIAGISGTTVASGVPVLVDSLGQLGTMTSSAEFKEDVRDIDCDGERILELRPVSFRYKSVIDPDRRTQYGLVAEEVAAVMPELVQYPPGGEPATVRYHLLVPLLLKEIQKDRLTIEELRCRLGEQTEEIRNLGTRILRLEDEENLANRH